MNKFFIFSLIFLLFSLLIVQIKKRRDKMKFKYYVVAVIVTVLLITGCAGANKIVKTDSNDCIPEWFLVPLSAEDALYGTGMAEKSSTALAQKAADARAIQSIGEQMIMKVQSYVKDHLQEAGVAEDSEINELTASMAKIISESKLIGARIKERKPCGNTWYSLCEYKINSASTFITDTLKNEAKKKEALYNKIEAKINFDEMEKEIEKEFGKK